MDVTAAGFLFDMDGTLVDSTAVVEAVWTDFGRTYGIDPADIFAFSHGRQAIDTVTRLLPDLPRAERLEIARTLVAEESALADGVVAIGGAAAFLDALVDAGAPVALVTSAPRDLALGRMRAAAVPLPAVVVTAEDVARGKPAPDGYLLAAERLGVDPADCVAFEDAEAGLLSAAASGARVVVIGAHTSAASDGLVRLDGYHGLDVTREGPRWRVRVA